MCGNFILNRLIFVLLSVLRLAVPISGIRFALAGAAIVDTWFASQLGSQQLAGVALGNIVLSTIPGSLVYVASAAQAMIAATRDQERKSSITTSALLVAGIVELASVGLMALLLLPGVLETLGQKPAEIAFAEKYLHAMFLAAVPVGVFAAIRLCLTALGKPQVALLWTLLGFVLNFVFNGIFGLGWLGFPVMGVFGLGLSSACVYAILSLGLVYTIVRDSGLGLCQPRFEDMRTILVEGVPIALTVLAEISQFTLAGLMVGATGALGAHQIVTELNYFCFMLPSSFGQAIGVMVARRPRRKRLFLRASVVLCIAYGLVVNLMVQPNPAGLIGLFSKDAKLVSSAVPLMRLMGMMACFDAGQIILTNYLRGFRDNILPFRITTVSYLFGTILSFLLAFPFALGAVGVWLGLTMGLLVATFGLWQRAVRK
jgi:multidrug resistance protein, MATE family